MKNEQKIKEDIIKQISIKLRGDVTKDQIDKLSKMPDAANLFEN